MKKTSSHATPFSSLVAGEMFIFEREEHLGYEGARGPWMRTGTKHYVHTDDRQHRHTVGNTSVAVIRLADVSPRGAHARLQRLGTAITADSILRGAGVRK